MGRVRRKGRVRGRGMVGGVGRGNGGVGDLEQRVG